MQHLGKTEVEDLHVVINSQLDVCRLEIAVDDAALVRPLQPLGLIPWR